MKLIVTAILSVFVIRNMHWITVGFSKETSPRGISLPAIRILLGDAVFRFVFLPIYTIVVVVVVTSLFFR